jgi:hypothetical protein
MTTQDTDLHAEAKRRLQKAAPSLTDDGSRWELYPVTFTTFWYRILKAVHVSE